MTPNNNAQKRFLEAYDQLGDSIYRFARMRLSDHDAAFDLTQETFLRYWSHLQAGGIVAHERAFLFTIARHLIIDRYRARQAVSLDRLREDIGFDPADDRMTPPDAEAEGTLALALLGRLPDTYREVLFLRFVEGRGPHEIAAILNLSANAVSVRVHRGIEKLRILMRANPHVQTQSYRIPPKRPARGDDSC